MDGWQVHSIPQQQAAVLVAGVRKFLSHGWPPVLGPVAALTAGRGGAAAAGRLQPPLSPTRLPQTDAAQAWGAAVEERPARYWPPQQRIRGGVLWSALLALPHLYPGSAAAQCRPHCFIA